MKYLIYGHRPTVSLLTWLWRSVRRAWPAGSPPIDGRPHRNRRRRLLGKWAPLALLLVSFVVQVVLVLLAGYLVDLGISLMELWAELARKHLELTM